MSSIRSKRALAAILVTAVLGTTFWACSSPPTIGAKVTLGPVGGEVTVTPGGEKVVDVTGPSGLCWRIVFVGADGANISTTIVTVPGSAQVPPGTVRIDYDPVPCPEAPDLAVPGSGSPLRSNRLSAAAAWRDVYSFPVDMSSMNGAICHARVWCGANQSPSAILRPVLIAGPGAAVPPNVQICFFADASPGLLGTTVRVAAPSPIVALNLTWNGMADFADLASGVNAIPGALSNSWSTVEIFVAATDADLSPGAWNRAGLTMETLARPQLEPCSLEFQIQPN